MMGAPVGPLPVLPGFSRFRLVSALLSSLRRLFIPLDVEVLLASWLPDWRVSQPMDEPGGGFFDPLDIVPLVGLVLAFASVGLSFFDCWLVGLVSVRFWSVLVR